MASSKPYGNKDVMDSSLKFPIAEQTLSTRDVFNPLSTKAKSQSPKVSVFILRRNPGNMRSDATQVE